MLIQTSRSLKINRMGDFKLCVNFMMKVFDTRANKCIQKIKLLFITYKE